MPAAIPMAAFLIIEKNEVKIWDKRLSLFWSRMSANSIWGIIRSIPIPIPVINMTSKYICQLLLFVKITKRKPNIVRLVPNWRRNIFENFLPYKYQKGVDINVIKKYKINKYPAYSVSPKYSETNIINKFAVKLLASKLKNVM